jgi:nucleoside-diphosphate-sugar epimerase
VILVTGGTGFVGRHLVDALAARGDAVRVLARHAPTSTWHPSVELLAGDITDRAAIDRTVHGVHTVVHLAALVGDAARPDDLATVNVRASADVASAARGAGVRRFVHMSSGGVYGDGETETPHRETDPPRPGTAYERSKLESEQTVAEALKGSSASWIVLRPAGLYGSDRPATQAFVNDVRTRRVWIHATPRVIVHPTHVSDVVQACVRAIDDRSLNEETLNVAGERPLLLQELVSLTAGALHVRAPQIVIPAWIGRPTAAVLEPLVRASGRTPLAVLGRMKRRCVNRSLDTDRARRALGFKPVPLEAGLSELAAALRKHEARVD